ncbi:ParB/Srx family N-terminal domain-containing protein [Magnetococcales bacterium HHB-1]
MFRKTRSLLFSLIFMVGTGEALAEDSLPTCMTDTKVGTHCMLSMDKIHPTQFAVGVEAATCKFNKINSEVEKKSPLEAINAYLIKKGKKKDRPKKYKNVVPTIIAPDGKFYITDRHHLSYAVWLYQKAHKLDKSKILFIARIDVNKHGSKQKMQKFWASMKKINKFWPYNEKGEQFPGWDSKDEKDWIIPGGFPVKIAQLKDDSFRTLSRWVREACAYLKEDKKQCHKSFGKPRESDYMEYRWANYLRHQFGKDKNQYHGEAMKRLYPKARYIALDITEDKAKGFWKDYYKDSGHNDSWKVCDMDIYDRYNNSFYCEEVIRPFKKGGKKKKKCVSIIIPD